MLAPACSTNQHFYRNFLNVLSACDVKGGKGNDTTFRIIPKLRKATTSMAQMLFYENVAAVSPQRHGDLSIDREDFSFAANVNSVPLMAVEMTAAASEYTIVFAGDDKNVMPVVILGLEGTKNYYVGEDGNWTVIFPLCL